MHLCECIMPNNYFHEMDLVMEWDGSLASAIFINPFPNDKF